MTARRAWPCHASSTERNGSAVGPGRQQPLGARNQVAELFVQRLHPLLLLLEQHAGQVLGSGRLRLQQGRVELWRWHTVPTMLVRDVMNPKAARIGFSSTLQQAAELLVLSQASDLVVVDEEGLFVGVVSEGDLIRAMMPDMQEVVSSGGTLRDAFRVFLGAGRDLAQQPIKSLVISNPITVSPDDELLKVATAMIDNVIRRLPVVQEGRFVGSISRADICWAALCADRGRK